METKKNSFWKKTKAFVGTALGIAIPVLSLVSMLVTIISALQSQERPISSSEDDCVSSSHTSRPSDYNWNSDASTWEKNGIPAAYRVTWRDINDGSKEHSMDFKDIDCGYDYYQYVRKTPGLYGAVWEHVYPDSE